MKCSLRILVATLLGLALAACGGGGSSPSPTGGSPPTAANTPPTISAVPSQTVAQDSSSDQIAFSVNDVESQASGVTVTAESSNPDLLSPDAIEFAGNDDARQMMIVPAAGQSGTATVTLVATDSDGLSARQSFDVTVGSQQRSFLEMVETARTRSADSDGEQIAGFSWVDNPEDDDTAFDDLFTH